MQRMPKGIISLYFVQAFSTFSYAVLYSSLSLYMTKALGLSNKLSNSVVGLFLAFNFVLHLLGGLMGGRLLSNRALFLSTTLLQSVGILLLAQSQSTMLYYGLSLFLIGCGLNTTCYNTLLTQRFEANDKRLDKAFLISYSAMNIGFFAGYIFSGFYDTSNQYEQVFYISFATNIISLLFILHGWSSLFDKDTPLTTHSAPKQSIRTWTGTGVMLLLVPLLSLCFHSADIGNSLVIVTTSIALIIIFIVGLRQKTKIDKNKVMTYLILTITSIIFWMIYFTGPIGITLFIKHNVDRHLLNFQLATQWILNINPFIIIIGSPALGIAIQKLQERGINFSISKQFTGAFLMLSLAFLFLSCGVKFSDSHGYCNINWVILYSVALAIAELLIGPLGYAVIGRLAPKNLYGVLMGTWMMASGVSASLSSYFSNAMVKSESINPLMTNNDFLSVFNHVVIWSLASALFLYLISAKIHDFYKSEELSMPNNKPFEA